MARAKAHRGGVRITRPVLYYAKCSCGWAGSAREMESEAAADFERHLAYHQVEARAEEDRQQGWDDQMVREQGIPQ